MMGDRPWTCPMPPMSALVRSDDIEVACAEGDDARNQRPDGRADEGLKDGAFDRHAQIGQRSNNQGSSQGAHRSMHEEWNVRPASIQWEQENTPSC